MSDAGTFYLYENRESEEDLDMHLSAPLDDDGLRIDRPRRIA